MFKKPFVLGILTVLVVGAIGASFWLGSTTESSADYIIASRKDVAEEVSVTGRVESAQSVDLAFEQGGKVTKVFVRVSDKVLAGASLVALENSELMASLSEARAGVSSAEAGLKQYQAALDSQKVKLDELKRGTRPEEIRLAEVKLENAKSAVLDAQKNMADKIVDAHTKADDAIRNKTDQLFTNPTTAPQFNFQITNQQLENDIESGRLAMESTLNTWHSSLSSIDSAGNLAPHQIRAEDSLNAVKAFLDKIAFMVNSLTSSGNLSQTTIDAYKADISTARININTAIGNLTAAEEKIKTSESGVLTAEQELSIKKAGSTEDQIRAQEAAVRQAEANVLSGKAQIVQAQASIQSIEARLGKAIIRAPFAGTVTRVDAKVGQIASVSASSVSLISEADFEIKAGVPEADIAKVKPGNDVHITLDAYGSDVRFDGSVSSIDPAETIVEGVATYQITVQFKNKDERIKSGMTANMNIFGEKRINIIAIPQRAVINKDGHKVVRILKGSDEKNPVFEDVPVETGLRGSDGSVEIIQGISEGDRVVVYSEEN